MTSRPRKQGLEPRRREGREEGRIRAKTMDIEEIAKKIVAAAIKVHTALGPGLLESAYQKCMEYDLKNDGLRVACELVLPIRYGEITIDAGYRIDMIVEESILIENKTVERFLPIHEAQLLTYLKMKNCRLGFLLNWNVPRMKDGIKRMVNNL
jgi:GxxExxY protein